MARERASRVWREVSALWEVRFTKRAKKDFTGKRLGGEGERLRRTTLFRNL
jgi:hypothetical protein